MDVAIIGLPQSGKTTVFNSLTRGIADTTGQAEMHVGVVKVPDPRLDVLGEMYQRNKIVHAEIKYWDIPAPPGRPQGIGGKYRNVLQGADAFLLVVRAFNDPTVPHPLEGLDAGRLQAIPERDDDRSLGKFHGLARTLVANAVHGVFEGFKKELDIVGIGYRAFQRRDLRL